MIQVAAVLAVLSVIDQFAKHPLVKRLLENWSHGTSNRVDDWVVDALTDSEPTVIERKLEAAQATYNRLDVAEKQAAKVSTPLPEEVIDVLLSREA